MNGLSRMSLTHQINHDVQLDDFCIEIRERACTGEFDEQGYVSLEVIVWLRA